MVDGLADTGRVITSAALIMVCVFSSFVLNGNAIVKEFGVGLAVAIAIDATIVRCLAVPAVMALIGRRGLVAAEVARPRAAADQHRGRGLLRRARQSSSPSPDTPPRAGGGMTRSAPDGDELGVLIALRDGVFLHDADAARVPLLLVLLVDGAVFAR